MALFGMPNGGGFFPIPSPFPLPGLMCEGLALNVLRSMQFSCMWMKGLRSSSRTMKNLDKFGEQDMDGRSGERLRWRANGCGKGGMGRISGGSSRAGMGRPALGRSRIGRGRISSRGGAGRRARCVGDNPGTQAQGEGSLHENVGRNKGPASSGETKLSDRNQCCEKAARGGKSGDVSLGGHPEATITEGATGSFVPESSIPGDMVAGEFRVASESIFVSEASSRMTNRTLLVARLGAFDGITDQFKPMKGFMKSVKMATGVVSGVKSATGVIQRFQSPASGVLMGFGAANGVVLGFETARVLVKGAKISKDFVSVWKSTRTRVGVNDIANKNGAAARAVREKFVKGLKASDGALTLMMVTKDFVGGLGGTVQDSVSNWDIVSKSYDASNGVLKVFEAALGLKGGGIVGIVGKGFTSLKVAVGGLGLSMKLVKGVLITKEISIIFLKGFGLTKTVMAAFKAIKDGERMVKWMMYKAGLDETRREDLPKLRRISLRNGPANDSMFELLVTDAKASANGSQDTSPSMMFSLATLLLAAQGCDKGDPREDNSLFLSMWPLCILSLALPS